jgi:hypothetical protein
MARRKSVVVKKRVEKSVSPLRSSCCTIFVDFLCVVIQKEDNVFTATGGI